MRIAWKKIVLASWKQDMFENLSKLKKTGYSAQNEIKFKNFQTYV